MILAIDMGNTNIVIGGIQDGVIAFFTAVGLASVVWVLAGAFLGAGRPMIPGLALLEPLRPEALALCAAVQAAALAVLAALAAIPAARPRLLRAGGKKR